MDEPQPAARSETVRFCPQIGPSLLPVFAVLGALFVWMAWARHATVETHRFSCAGPGPGPCGVRALGIDGAPIVTECPGPECKSFPPRAKIVGAVPCSRAIEDLDALGDFGESSLFLPDPHVVVVANGAEVTLASARATLAQCVAGKSKADVAVAVIVQREDLRWLTITVLLTLGLLALCAPTRRAHVIVTRKQDTEGGDRGPYREGPLAISRARVQIDETRWGARRTLWDFAADDVKRVALASSGIVFQLRDGTRATIADSRGAVARERTIEEIQDALRNATEDAPWSTP